MSFKFKDREDMSLINQDLYRASNGAGGREGKTEV